jgi:hypothetical protein
LAVCCSSGNCSSTDTAANINSSDCASDTARPPVTGDVTAVTSPSTHHDCVTYCAPPRQPIGTCKRGGKVADQRALHSPGRMLPIGRYPDGDSAGSLETGPKCTSSSKAALFCKDVLPSICRPHIVMALSHGDPRILSAGRCRSYNYHTVHWPNLD